MEKVQELYAGIYSVYRGVTAPNLGRSVVRASRQTRGTRRRGFEIFLCRTRRSRDAEVCAAGRPSTSFPPPGHVSTRCSPDLFRAADSARKRLRSTRLTVAFGLLEIANVSYRNVNPFFPSGKSSSLADTCSGASTRTENCAKCKNTCIASVDEVVILFEKV